MPDDPSPNPAWTDSDLAENPHAMQDKASRVERMFASIAHAYDLNNRLHSLWRDQAWRRAAVRMADLQPTDRVLDVACGTGDLTIAFRDALMKLGQRKGTAPASVPPSGDGAPHSTPQAAACDRATDAAAPILGIDFTLPMLAIARQKASDIAFVQGDAMRLPLPDESVDVVSIAFGIRNVADPAQALREFRRVLKPGGRVIILEFSQPTNPLIRFADRVYRERVMPLTATLIARDRSGAYKYLPKSVSTFYTREQMHAALAAAGLGDVTHRPLTCGIAVCYRASRPR